MITFCRYNATAATIGGGWCRMYLPGKPTFLNLQGPVIVDMNFGASIPNINHATADELSAYCTRQCVGAAQAIADYEEIAEEPAPATPAVACLCGKTNLPLQLRSYELMEVTAPSSSKVLASATIVPAAAPSGAAAKTTSVPASSTVTTPKRRDQKLLGVVTVAFVASTH